MRRQRHWWYNSMSTTCAQQWCIDNSLLLEGEALVPGVRSTPGPAPPCPPSLFPLHTTPSIPSSSSQPQPRPLPFQTLSQDAVGLQYFSPMAAPQSRVAAWWSLTPHACSTRSCACPRHPPHTWLFQHTKEAPLSRLSFPGRVHYHGHVLCRGAGGWPT